MSQSVITKGYAIYRWLSGSLGVWPQQQFTCQKRKNDQICFAYAQMHVAYLIDT